MISGNTILLLVATAALFCLGLADHTDNSDSSKHALLSLPRLTENETCLLAMDTTMLETVREQSQQQQNIETDLAKNLIGIIGNGCKVGFEGSSQSLVYKCNSPPGFYYDVSDEIPSNEKKDIQAPQDIQDMEDMLSRFKVCPRYTDCGYDNTTFDSRTEPAKCKAGQTCIIPTAPQDCPLGSYCPADSECIQICPLGYYCPTPAKRILCPADFYCPIGSFEAIECPPNDVCPEGSGHAESFYLIPILIMVPLVSVLFSDLLFKVDNQMMAKLVPMSKVPCLLALAIPVGGLLGVISPSLQFVPFLLLGVYFAIWALIIIYLKRTEIKGNKPRAVVSTMPKELTEPWNTEDSADQAVCMHEDNGHGDEQKQGFEFRLEDVNFFTGIGSSRAQRLHNISTTIKANSLVAIMGPSGCGKTTLLNTLCGRAEYGQTKGTIYCNGQAGIVDKLCKSMGFVPQDDVMHSELTVYENIIYQGYLRLPKTSESPAEVANHVLAYLGLEHIKGERIGDEIRRGISGGQKKRVNIGMEIVSKPLALFLDEPTSGLDSTTSHRVISTMKTIAKDGCTVAAVIHQPAWKSLQLFHHIILLAKNGHLCYSGPVSDVKQFFIDKHGVEFPWGANPADILMECISQEDSKDDECDHADLVCKTKTTKEFADIWAKEQKRVSTKIVSGTVEHRDTGSHLSAMGTLYLRSISVAWRLWMSNLMMTFICCFGVTVVCFGFPNTDPISFLQQIGGLILNMMIIIGVKAQNSYGRDEAMGKREQASGMYSCVFTASLASIFHEFWLVGICWGLTVFLLSETQLGLLSALSLGMSLATATVLMNIVVVLLVGNRGILSAILIAFISSLMGGITGAYDTIQENTFLWLVSLLSPARWAYGYASYVEAQAWTKGYLAVLASEILNREGFDFYKANVSAVLERDAEGDKWVMATSPRTLFSTDIWPLWYLAAFYYIVAAIIFTVKWKGYVKL